MRFEVWCLGCRLSSIMIVIESLVMTFFLRKKTQLHGPGLRLGKKKESPGRLIDADILLLQKLPNNLGQSPTQ